MKVLIEIDEKMYQNVLNGTYCGTLYEALKNGTPLPKGHGRLIDADELEECKEIMNTISGESKYAVRMDDIRDMPTIIEADKAESENKE